MKLDDERYIQEIYIPKTLEDSLLQGQNLYKSFSIKKDNEFDYIDEITGLYLGLVLWYLKSLQNKSKIDLLNYKTFKAFLLIDIAELPIILTFSNKEIKESNVIPYSLIFKQHNSIVKYIISGINSMFSKTDKEKINKSIMKVFAKEVENKKNDIKHKLKILYFKEEDSFYDQIKMLKFWLIAYK